MASPFMRVENPFMKIKPITKRLKQNFNNRKIIKSFK